MKVALPLGKQRSWPGLGPGTPSRKQIGILAVAGLLSVFVGYTGYERITADSQTAPTIQTTAVRRGSLVSTVSSTGSVIAVRQAKLGFSASGSASGKLIELDSGFGDSVKAGQLLAKLDPVPFQVKVDTAQSDLDNAQADLKTLMDGATPDERAAAQAAYDAALAKYNSVAAGTTPADLAAAQASVDQAQANLKLDQMKLDQLQNNTYTQADWVSAQTAVDTATSSIKSAQSKLDDVKKGPSQSDIASQQAAVNQAKQSLTSAEDRYQMAQNNDLADSGYSSVSAAAQAYSTAKANYDATVQKLNDLMAGPLATDLQTAQTSVDQAQANLKNAQAKLDLMKQGPQPTDLASAQNAVDQAKATFASAQAKLQQLQQAPTDADLKAAKSALASAKLDLDNKVGPPKDSDVAKAQGAVKQAQVNLEQAQNDLQNATLVAPFDGIVAAVAGNVGEMVGSATVVTLVDPNSIRIDGAVDETDVANIKVGQQATVTFDAVPGQTFQGKVTALSPVGTTTQGVVSYQLSVTIDSQGRTLPAGMSAAISIVTDRKDNVLLVPSRAVRTQGRAKMVEVVAGEKTEMKPVETGASNDQSTEITSGLAEGEQVVIPSTTIRSTMNNGGRIGGPMMVR